MTNLYKMARVAALLIAAAAGAAHAQGPAQSKPVPQPKSGPALPSVELSPELLYKIMMA